MAAVSAVALMLLSGCGGQGGAEPTPASALTADRPLAPAPEGIPGVVEVPVATAKHVDGKVSYPTVPPAGGPHNSAWQNCGFYTVAVTAERAVHSLEHGAVWIAYADSLDGSVKSQLAALTRTSPYLLISPVDDMPSPIAVVAWGRLLRLESFDAAAINRFVAAYAQKGPTVPEPGAPCWGAIGRPPDKPNGT